MTAWTLRPMVAEDLPSVAELHRTSFPGSMLGRLGADLVGRYYASTLRGSGVEGWVASGDGHVGGFLVGGRFAGETSTFVHDNWFLLIRRIAARPWLVARAGSLRIARIGAGLLARPATGTAEVAERVPADSFGVLAVAVDPDQRRRGVGRALLGAAEDRARELGCERMHLTLNPSNEAAMGFYRGLGWRHPGIAGDTSAAWLMTVELA